MGERLQGDGQVGVLGAAAEEVSTFVSGDWKEGRRILE